MNTHQKIRELLDKLIADGESVLNTKWQPSGNWVSGPPTYVDLAIFTTWRARCKLLASLLGRVGKPWETILTSDLNNSIESAITTQSTIQAIKVSAEEGLLLEIEDIVLAEAFANLIEQAEYLLTQGYYLAAGVIFRAVLEERLRRLCDQHSLALSKPKPTLNDYNTELYKAQVYDKITFKDIGTLIAIGNDAAHNNSTLSADNVQNMFDGITRILSKFSS
jgi:hypothetical protein